MSEVATYKLQVDWDRDHWFNDGVSASDPLNLIPSPVTWHGLRWDVTSSHATAALSYEDTDYGTQVMTVDTGGFASSGVLIGQNPDTDIIDCIAVNRSTQYTVRVWLKVTTGAGNLDLTLEVRDQQPVVISSSSITATTSWAAYTLTFTTNENTMFIRISVFKRTNADQVIFKLAGLMLVAGASAPSVFNAGAVSNAYDDIWAYCEEGLSFNYGIPQYTEAVAPASGMTITVNNMDGIFSPENPPADHSLGSVGNTVAPVIGDDAYVGVEIAGDDGAWLRPGFFTRGALIRLTATYSGTDYVLYIGTLDAVRVDVGAFGSRRAVLTVVDPVPQLNSAQYDPPLLENVTTGDVLQAVFDSGVLQYPYPGDYWRLGVEGAGKLDINTYLYENRLTDFETGDTTLAFAGDTSGSGILSSALEFIREDVYAELGGRFFWDARVGKFKFFSRTRDILYLPTIEAPGVLELDDPPEYLWGDDTLNFVTVTYYPRVVGATNSVMYTMGNVPMALTSGQTRTMTVRYQVTDASNAEVAGQDMTPPVATTDYSATLNSDGTGGDVTTSLDVSCTYYANTATLTLHNSNASTIYIQFFQMRGTPLISYRAVQTTSFDGASIVANGEYRRTIDIPALGDADLAEAYAGYLTQRYKTPVGRIAGAALFANRDADTLVNVLDMSIGNHIRLYDSFLNNQVTNYVVSALTHTISPVRHHWLRLTVEPLDRYLYWILDDVDLSILDSTTRLSL